MAGGLTGFLGFGKSRKTNLTPDVPRPLATDLAMNKTLRDYAKSRIAGVGTGFGDDFVDKATNPTIQASNTRFREETLPGISNAASARGINRSTLATDQINKAYRNQGQDIDQLVSQFEVLNRQQKKTDEASGVGVAQNLDSQEAGLMTSAADASERLADKTAGRADALNAQDRARQNQTLQALGGAVGGPIGASVSGAFGGGGDLTKMSTKDLLATMNGNSGVQVDTLGGGNNIQNLINKLLGRRGQSYSTPPAGYDLGFNPFGKVNR